jgi:hypothetical protein
MLPQKGKKLIITIYSPSIVFGMLHSKWKNHAPKETPSFRNASRNSREKYSS